MAVVDGRGHVVRANDALGALLGTTAGALADRQACELVDLASDDRTWLAYREVLQGRRSRFRCTRRLKHPDGRTLWAEVTVVPMTGTSAAEPARVLLTVADVSDRRELQDRLRHLQMHDPVTRLPNRTLFFERLSVALETPPYQDDSMLPGTAGSGSAIWTWTASRPSTTPWATGSGTGCWPPSPGGSTTAPRATRAATRAAAGWWRAWAATSSRSWWRTPAGRRR